MNPHPATPIEVRVAGAALPVDPLAIEEVCERVAASAVDSVAVDAQQLGCGRVLIDPVERLAEPPGRRGVAKLRMALKAEWYRQRPGHSVRLAEAPHRVAEGILGGEQLHAGAPNGAGARMAIDATKVRVVLVPVDQRAAVDTRQIHRNQTVEVLTDLRVKRRRVGQVTRNTEVVVALQVTGVQPASRSDPNGQRSDQGQDAPPVCRATRRDR